MMDDEQELTDEELHRNAIRARLAEVSAANRERHRTKAMLIAVAEVHAKALAQQLATRMRPAPPTYRMRPWLRRLKHLVLSPFFWSPLSASRKLGVLHRSSRAQLKVTDKRISI